MHKSSGDRQNRSLFLSLSQTTIITTHLNTDFDGFASAVAASLLYPGAVIVLPGSMERPLREFVRDFPDTSLPLKKFKEIEPGDVRRLVVVDTCQRGRIGRLADFLDRDEVEVIVYDHHTPDEDDCIKTAAGRSFFSGAGANTTFMTGFLREKGIPISPRYATLFLLGIHEDTGSFTYSSTTPEDLDAAAWLLEQGADLDQVARVINSRITPEHVSLLNDLLETSTVYNIGGTEVAVAKTSSAGYVEDFSVLAHELMDIRHFPALFVIVLMADQVLIVGRSRTHKVDAGAILRELGGGGHAMAASATMKGLTLAEAENRLIARLEKALGHEPRVRDIMSSPVISASPDAPLYEVHDTINRYGISGIPIVEDGRMVGLISRSTVEKAIYHGLARLPVGEYMSTDFRVVSPDAGVSEVQEVMVGLNQRFVPVVESDRLVGVVTRTDLLRMLAESPTRHHEPAEEKGQTRDISALLRQKLSPRILEIFSTAGQVAAEMNARVYVVGGFVRDLLLRVPNFDIDLVVEGDGIAFARAFAERFGARVKEHKKFQTAVVIFPDDFRVDSDMEPPFKVDVATARWEYYEYPAAMPTVALSSIKLDLFRRDFTINTLAVRLDPDGFGTLIDFFGGQRDIRDGIIRVLHSLSFIEDPTRVFRAVRFEQRYGFKIGKHTLNLIKNAVNLNIFKRLSGRRLERELRLILREQDPRPAIERCGELDILKFIHPSLKLADPQRHLIDATYDVLAWYRLLFRPEPVRQWVLYLLALLSGLNHQEYIQCIKRLRYGEAMRRILLGQLERGRKALSELENNPDISPGRVCILLKGLAPEIVLHLLAVAHDREDERTAHWISRYITTLQDIKIEITGDDLLDMGIKPGPVYREIFSEVLMAKLDGKVFTKDEELALAAEIAGRERG